MVVQPTAHGHDAFDRADVDCRCCVEFAFGMLLLGSGLFPPTTTNEVFGFDG